MPILIACGFGQKTLYFPVCSVLNRVCVNNFISSLMFRNSRYFIKIKGCLKINVTTMLMNPLIAKHPNNQIETFCESIWLVFVTESIIAIGPEIAKRNTTKSFYNVHETSA